MSQGVWVVGRVDQGEAMVLGAFEDPDYAATFAEAFDGAAFVQYAHLFGGPA